MEALALGFIVALLSTVQALGMFLLDGWAFCIAHTTSSLAYRLTFDYHFLFRGARERVRPRSDGQALSDLYPHLDFASRHYVLSSCTN